MLASNTDQLLKVFDATFGLNCPLSLKSLNQTGLGKHFLDKIPSRRI